MQSVSKWKKIYVESRLKYETYEDNQGITRYVKKIVANEFQVLSDRDNGKKEEVGPEKTEEDAVPF